MSMPLKDVLADPALVAAEPVVLAGWARLRQLVTWVHTSEVLDIATLLRGGELLLVGGVSLATASREERVAYVREIAECKVAGIAIETGSRLKEVPREMVQEANRIGLPLIQLRRVVRFVEVTQAINSLLVNGAVRRLQLADQVSHALALGLANGAELTQLMEILAVEAQADTRLTTPNGEVLAEVLRSPPDPHDHPDGHDQPNPAGPLPGASSASAVKPFIASVNSAGVTVALLTLTPLPGSNLMLLDAALDRAPEALGLAMLRFRPLSRVERDTHELLALAGSEGAISPRRLTEVAARLGIDRYDAWVTTVARIGPGPSLVTGIEAAVGGAGRTVISQIDRDLHTCVIAMRLTGTTLAAARQLLIEDLRSVPLPPQLTVAVGPGARTLSRLSHCLREARSTLDLTDEAHPAVADSVALGVTRLVAAIDRDDLVSTFIDEQIGDLITLDGARQSQLVHTLATYLRHSSNKTATASVLHLQRQSLYQRLDRIMATLGHPEPGSSRWAAVTLATELETARRLIAGDAESFDRQGQRALTSPFEVRPLGSSESVMKRHPRGGR
ncbi:MAG: PucR family transcriptional regulator ligand-binding domain-containing protein [Terracoccus sp.]